MTGMPDSTILATAGTAGTPPSSLTAWTPASFMNRIAVARAWSAPSWYEPNGRSPMTRARLVDRTTARASGMSSSTVTGTVSACAKTLLAAESPTSSTGTPAWSKISAVYMSYEVSIGQRSPRSLATCRSRIVTRRENCPPYSGAVSLVMRCLLVVSRPSDGSPDTLDPPTPSAPRAQADDTRPSTPTVADGLPAQALTWPRFSRHRP